NTAPEYFGLMGVAHGPLRRRHSGKGRAVPERLPIDRSFFVAFLWLYLPMPSSTGRARRAVLVTAAMCWRASLAHAQQQPSIESLSESYVTCVQSAFVRRLDDFGASICHKRPNERFSTVNLRKMPSTQLRLPRHPAILKLSPWSVPRSNNSRLN